MKQRLFYGTKDYNHQLVYTHLKDHTGKKHQNIKSNMCACKVASVVLLFATLSTVACQALLSMGFSKQEYWGGFTCPPPGRRTLPDPGIDLHLYVFYIARWVLYH